MDLILTLCLAVTGLLGGWLECFKNGRPTKIGFILIITVLVVTTLLYSNQLNTLNQNIARETDLMKKLEETQKTLARTESSQNRLEQDASLLKGGIDSINTSLQEKMSADGGFIVNRANVQLALNSCYEYSSEVSLEWPVNDQSFFYLGREGEVVLKPDSLFCVENIDSFNNRRYYFVVIHTRNTNANRWEGKLLRGFIDSLSLDQARLSTSNKKVMGSN